MKLLLIHGPNLHLLGRRQREIYGDQTLADINAHLLEIASQRGVETQNISVKSRRRDCLHHWGQYRLGGRDPN